MATTPDGREYPLNIREQPARIDQIQTDIGQKLVGADRTRQEMRLAPWALVFTSLGAGAALFAAGATFAKLLIH